MIKVTQGVYYLEKKNSGILRDSFSKVSDALCRITVRIVDRGRNESMSRDDTLASDRGTKERYTFQQSRISRARARDVDIYDRGLHSP